MDNLCLFSSAVFVVLNSTSGAMNSVSRITLNGGPGELEGRVAKGKT